MRQVNTLSGRGPGGPQAHPVAPRAQYLRRSDPPPSRFAGFARIGRAAGWLAVVAILGFLLVWAMLEPAPARAATGGDVVQADAVSLISTARAADRLRTIPESPVLDAIAATRAGQITSDFAHHLIPVPGASVWGEVIAWEAYPSRIAGAQAVAGFLGSPEHRAILLGRWTAYGVGVAWARGRWYVVGIFATWPRP